MSTEQDNREASRLRRLRDRAEAALSRSEAISAPLSEAVRLEVGSLIEELRVYQAELEIQNQELGAAQQRAEALRDRFTRLFTALPLPALVVDERGLVREANVEARRLFAMAGQAGARSVHRLLCDREDPVLWHLLETARSTTEPRKTARSIGFRTTESDDHRFLVHAIAVHENGETPQVELLLIDQTGPERVESERLALERQTERFLRAQQAADVGTWDANLEVNRITWDATALGLLGLDPQRAVFDRASWEAMVHPDDLPGVIERFRLQPRADDERFDHVARYRHADGRWIWLRDSGRVIDHDAKGVPVRLSGIVRNVDAEHRARQAAEAASARLQRFAERAPGAFHQLVCDAEGQWTIAFAGGRFAEVFGLDPQAAQQDPRALAARFAPEDLSALAQAAANAARQQTVLQMELRITDADGTQRWLETQASPEATPDGGMLWHGFTRDVSLRRRQADAEREIRQRLQLAGEIADIGVWTWNLDTGQIDWDDRMHTMYGLPPGSPIDGKFWRQQVHPDDQDRQDATLKRALAQGEGGSDVFRILLPDNQVRVLQTAWRTERHPDGTVRRVVGVHRDITAQRQAEAALIAAKEAAEAANEAKGRFLANVGHEVRTPLNAMLGLAGVLLNEPLQPRQRERLEKIRSAGAVLLQILNDILDQSKMEAGLMLIESVPLQVRDVLDRCHSLFDVQAEARGLRLDITAAEDVPAVLLGDPLRLQQALGNLVGNALKFTEQGTVSVHVACETRDSNHVTLRISVRDTGIGVPPEQLPTLFAPFQQGDSSISRRYGGTGLGLSIVKRLAELMGGTAGATSTPGQGSTFWFTARLGIPRIGTSVAPPLPGPSSTTPEPAPEPVHETTPRAEIDLEALQPSLQELERRLCAGRADARAMAADISAQVAGTALQARWHPIARAVATFDFKTAREQLESLQNEHG